MRSTLKTLLTASYCLALACPAYAGSLDELQSLAGASPEEYGQVFDKAAPGSGAPDTRAMSQQQLKQMMTADLDNLRNIILVRYAPGGWKTEQYGWDLDAEIQKAKDKVNAPGPISLKEYQQIVKVLMNSTKDYHMNVLFTSTEESMLPLAITQAGGRYFIVSIDRRVLPENVFPFHEGDEIVGFCGREMGAAVAALGAVVGLNDIPNTDLGLLANSFFDRQAGEGFSVPTGQVTIRIKPAGPAPAQDVALDWIYFKDLVPQQPFARAARGGDADALLFPWMNVMLGGGKYAGENTSSSYGIGNKDGFLPLFGEKLWEAPADGAFRAYIYRSPADGRRIGYVRIANYIPKNADKNVADFAALMTRFNDETDELVIDQLNNPGGYVLYMYSLLSMLTGQPLQLPKYKVTLTQGDVLSAAVEIGNSDKVKTDEDAVKYVGKPSLFGYPVDYAYFSGNIAMYRDFVANWGSGETLSKPLSLLGIDRLPPHKTARYTKPVLVLVNELDISCGDFFPAILQDNGRAAIFGERTSGAGGAVMKVDYPPNLLGIESLRITSSIAVRPNGQPLENLGVTPDIKYSVKPEDVQGGYKGYAAAVNAALAGL